MSHTHSEQLQQWLTRLVALLFDAGDPLSGLLIRTVSKSSAVIKLDDVILKVGAEWDGNKLNLQFSPAPTFHPHQFQTTGDILRDIIAGRTLLDAAIVSGDIEVRASLPKMLAFYEIVMKALALSARSRPLRELWQDFDTLWPRSGRSCLQLDSQQPDHGRLIAAVPMSVLLVSLRPLFRGNPEIF